MVKERFLIYTLISLFILSVVVNNIPRVWAAASNKVTQKSPYENLTLLKDFDSLQEYIAGLPDSDLGKGPRNSLIKKVENAKSAYHRGQPCTATNILQAYLNETQALRQGKAVEIAEGLYNKGRALKYALLSSLPADQACKDSSRIGMKPQVAIPESNNQRLIGTVTFGEARTWSVRMGGELFTQLEIPGVPLPIGEPGLPAVPIYRRLIAVPRGATVSVKVTNPPVISEIISLNLYPIQQPTPEKGKLSSNASLFMKNKEIYAANSLYPVQVCTVTPLGRLRDLKIAQISCAVGQYEPARSQLSLFRSFDFEVTFSGGSGFFLPEAALSPFERLPPFENFINGNIFLDNPDYTPRDFYCNGEELMILTHPDFRSAADRLAQWKRDKGILTSVFEVNDGSGPGPDTLEEIDALIEGRYDNCIVRPSYIMILGDVNFVPIAYIPSEAICYDNYGNPSPCVGSETIGSDYRYAQYETSDFLPDFAVGRIPVKSLDKANIAVNKIIGYESAPPTLNSFYENATLASHFHCCKSDAEDGTDRATFIKDSESLREGIASHGYSVERIYIKTVDDNYLGDATPRYYYNGTPLPADLAPGSGFVWDGDTQDIINAFNAGRFLMIHRNHAWGLGWSHPEFNTNHTLFNINNGNLLPVVFGVNCSSGIFDQELLNGWGDLPPDVISFGESLFRNANGGAVAYFGADRLALGPFDNLLMIGHYAAIFYFGQHRLGDVLNLGKLIMFNEAGDWFSEELGKDHVYSWHLLGDPTLEMWTSNPYGESPLPPTGLTVYNMETGSMRVGYPMEGAIITAFQEIGQQLLPIGRAVINGGAATLKYVMTPLPNLPIRFSASMENRISVSLTLSHGIDQVNDVPTEKSRGCGGPGSLFQSFTPSASFLSAVDLRLRVGGNFPPSGYTTNVAIRSGSPNGLMLGTLSAFVPGPQITGTQVNVHFQPWFSPSVPIPLTPGYLYVMEWALPPEGDGILTWMVAEGNPYPNGTAFGCEELEIAGEDFIFKTFMPEWFR